MKKALIALLCASLVALLLGGCSNKPANKCNTCPKWRSELPQPESPFLA